MALLHFVSHFVYGMVSFTGCMYYEELGRSSTLGIKLTTAAVVSSREEGREFSR